jgi:ABC-type Mn2+/Zn2+ transport system ATPase subunit
MSDAVVAARGLTVAYGDRVAVEDVSFSVPAGTSVAVLGPNGAGKSTIFAAAVGLAPVRAGEIEVASERIALVPQRLELTAGFPATALDVVRMGRYGALGALRRFRHRDHELVAAALAALGIEHLADRRFGELSGGERQRALLAQAAAQDPELLLLDEPFTGVDAPTGEAVRRLLERWRAEGRTTLVATHDLASAARDYDLVLCVNRRAVAFGPAAETITETVLAETFAGRILRVGDLVVDIAHHHHGAG